MTLLASVSAAADRSASEARTSIPPALRARAGRVKRHLLRRRNGLARVWHEEPDGEHLVPSPVFILCPVRSGSTLLRSMLNSHTQICAPHEMHLQTLQVTTSAGHAKTSWKTLGLDLHDLENMLWDRVMHRALIRSGKRIIVDKTPQNAAIWQRIHEFWPDARYIHLRRHPGSIAESLVAARPDTPPDRHAAYIASYGDWLGAARAELPGPTIRYEDLVCDTETTLREICRYLGVRYQPRMQRYRPRGNQPGLGDWSSKINSGRVQQARELPALEDVPGELHDLVRSWSY